MGERCYNCGSDKHLALQCPYIKTGPAPKEEEMTIHTGGVRTDVELPPRIIGPAPILDGQPRALERRAVAREAYMAALGGLSSIDELADDGIVQHATAIALETVRRWDAFMATVDAEGGE